MISHRPHNLQQTVCMYAASKAKPRTAGRTLQARLLVDDVWVLLVLLRGDAHLPKNQQWAGSAMMRTFLNVFKPARMEPPIHVEYLRSGGAYILILTSLSASFLTSFSSRAPYPVRKRVSVVAACRGVHTLVERAAAGEDDVAEEALAQVQVDAVDRVDDDLVHARVLLADDLRVEQDLGRSEALRSLHA